MTRSKSTSIRGALPAPLLYKIQKVIKVLRILYSQVISHFLYFINLQNEVINVLVHCSVCLKEKEITVTQEEFKNWQEGMLIQNAMPKLTPGDRELLLSGTCDDCFDKMFTGE